MEKPPTPPLAWLPPVLIFLPAFAFLLLGLNPTFYLNDSPETVTACATLGIPHPPGYPLHTLAGHFFADLPVGSLPFRINLFSAILAGGVCVLLFYFLRDRLSVSPRLSTLFSLFWVVGATLYPAGLSAKTGLYQLIAAFLLSILWALLGGRLGLAAFLFGLSLANHWMSMAAFLPGFLLLAYFLGQGKLPLSLPETGRMERARLLILPALAALGLSVYLFLPLRAHLNPWLNWGEPSTWEHFIFNFFRKQYSTPEGAGGAAAWFPQWGNWLQTAFFEFNGLLLPALWGLGRMFLRRRALALGLGLVWFFLLLATGLYLNLPKDQYYLIGDYTLSSHVFILLFTAFGLESWLSGREAGRRLLAERVIAGLLVILLGTLGFTRYAQARQTDYTYTYDYVLNGFQGLPRGALYYCKGDSVVFPSWYFQWIEEKRTDIAVVGVDGIPMDWIRKSLARFHPDLKVPFTAKPVGTEAIPVMVDWIIAHNPNRELYFSYNKIEDGTLPGEKLAFYGLTAKGFPAGAEPLQDDARAVFLWDHLRLRHLPPEDFPIDSRTFDNIVRDYAVFRNTLGVFYEDRADDAKARLTRRAQAADLLGIQADYQKSHDHFFWAQQFLPKDPQYAYNTGNSLFHLGRIQEAVPWYEKATRLKKDYTIAYFNWAVAELQLQHYSEAGRLFEKVLELNPDYPNAKSGLDFLAQNHLYMKK